MTTWEGPPRPVPGVDLAKVTGGHRTTNRSTRSELVPDQGEVVGLCPEHGRVPVSVVELRRHANLARRSGKTQTMPCGLGPDPRLALAIRSGHTRGHSRIWHISNFVRPPGGRMSSAAGKHQRAPIFASNEIKCEENGSDAKAAATKWAVPRSRGAPPELVLPPPCAARPRLPCSYRGGCLRQEEYRTNPLVERNRMRTGEQCGRVNRQGDHQSLGVPPDDSADSRAHSGWREAVCTRCLSYMAILTKEGLMACSACESPDRRSIEEAMRSPPTVAPRERSRGAIGQ